MTNSLVPVVSLQNGKPVCNSRDVAELFDKRHDHILHAIRDLISQLTPEISGLWFMPTKVDQKTGFGVRKVDAFDMTRDGFALLAMGFTGKKALQFKIAYINRFNEMEQALHSAARSNAIGWNEVREFSFNGLPPRAVATERGPMPVAIDLIRLIYPSARGRGNVALHTLDGGIPSAMRNDCVGGKMQSKITPHHGQHTTRPRFRLCVPRTPSGPPLAFLLDAGGGLFHFIAHGPARRAGISRNHP